MSSINKFNKLKPYNSEKLIGLKTATIYLKYQSQPAPLILRLPQHYDGMVYSLDESTLQLCVSNSVSNTFSQS